MGITDPIMSKGGNWDLLGFLQNALGFKTTSVRSKLMLSNSDQIEEDK